MEIPCKETCTYFDNNIHTTKYIIPLCYQIQDKLKKVMFADIFVIKCVRSVMSYSSETWPGKQEDLDCLETGCNPEMYNQGG